MSTYSPPFSTRNLFLSHVICQKSDVPLRRVAAAVRALPEVLRAQVLHRDVRVALPHLLPLLALPRPPRHRLHREGIHQVSQEKQQQQQPINPIVF